MKSDKLTKKILEHVGDRRYKPQSASDLAEQVGIARKEFGEFSDALEALKRTGRVVIGAGETVLLAEFGDRMIGTYRANPRGFGFVIPESPVAHGDLFIPPKQQLDAVTGDTVLAKVKKKGKRGGEMVYEGRIVEVLERGHSRFVGCLHQSAGKWHVWPDGRTLHVPILVPDAAAKKAKSGTQVVVEITQYPSERAEARGVIIEVLGRPGDYNVDTLSIIRQHHLPHELPEECVTEARQAATSFDPAQVAADRENLRQEVILTIDPDDARDFDDAISLVHRDGEWELGVHIADVSHFVRCGSRLDEEAKHRGNSVYFPGYVIPMLPEVLSNGVCSLQEGVPRLVKSAYVRYDEAGKVLGQRFANAVIQSDKRLTYAQATSILEGKTGGFSSKVVSLVKRMEELAKIIRKRRITQGMITLELPTVELVMNDDGQVVGVQSEDQSFSHTIIEMFMVEANEAVARLLTRLDVPHLRRIHPDPDNNSNKRLTQVVTLLGRRIPSKMDRAQIQQLLASVKGTPQSFAINMAVLRSMQPAEYSPQLQGHFALASQHYSHFTSPIRRYPDLTVHRLLDLYLTGELDTPAQRKNVPTSEELVELGSHCSFTERRAEDAERELKLVKILQLLSDRIGEEFRGVVTEVTRFGIFIQLEVYLVDGLIRVEELSGGWWEADPEKGCVVAERGGRCISIGDVLKVEIVKVDISSRRLDLNLVEQVTKRKRLAAPAKRGSGTQRKRSKSPGRGKKTGPKTGRRGGRRAR